MSDNFPHLSHSNLQPRDLPAPELEVCLCPPSSTASQLLTSPIQLLSTCVSHQLQPHHHSHFHPFPHILRPVTHAVISAQPALMSLDVFLSELRRHHLPMKARKVRLRLRMARRRCRCAICQETVKEKTVVPTLTCQHTFHRFCLAKWRRKHDSCPLCRHPLT